MPDTFENVICPLGTLHDKGKSLADDTSELYESLEMPPLSTQEDSYGGDNCKCSCHSDDGTTRNSSNEHCTSCGTRVIYFCLKNNLFVLN